MYGPIGVGHLNPKVLSPLLRAAQPQARVQLRVQARGQVLVAPQRRSHAYVMLLAYVCITMMEMVSIKLCKRIYSLALMVATSGNTGVITSLRTTTFGYSGMQTQVAGRFKSKAIQEITTIWVLT